MADLTPVSSGIVRGTFVAGVLDSADPGSEPDIVPMTGQVTISATTPYFRMASTTPPMTVFPTTLIIPLNAEGSLEYNGSTDINLWATTDPDMNPHDWQWHVAFQLQFNGIDIPYPSFNFTLDAAEVVDLTTAAPVATPSPGVAITKGEKGDPGDPGADGEDGAPGSPGPSAYDIAVLEGFVGDEAAWLASLQGEDGEPGAPGSGLTTYADEAAFTAETGAVVGTLSPATNWGAFTGITQLNAYSGVAIVETIPSIRNGSPGRTQTMHIAPGGAGVEYELRVQRHAYAGGAYGAWEWSHRVPQVTSASSPYQAANKAYADAVGLTLVTGWANMDSLDAYHSLTGRVTDPGFDLGAATGIAAYNGLGGGAVWFEHSAGYVDESFNTAQIQRAWIPRPSGTVDEIRRSRFASGAWTPWAIYDIDTGPQGEPGLDGASAVPRLYPKSGFYLAPNSRAVANGSGAWSTGQQPGTPFVFDRTVSIDALALRVTTLEAGALASIRVYEADSDGYPLTLVASVSGIDCSTTGGKQGVLGAPFDFGPGMYWGFIRPSSPGGLVRFQSHTPNEALGALYSGIASAPGASPQYPKVDTGPYATPTATLSGWTVGDVSTNQSPFIFMRRA